MRFFIHMRRLIAAIACVVLIVGVVGGVPGHVQAQVDGGDVFGVQAVEGGLALGGGAQDLRVTIANIIRVALGLLGIVALVIVIYGGFVYMTSGGSEDKVAQGKKILINGAIGLGIIMASFAITQFVISRLSDATGVGQVAGQQGGPGGDNNCPGLGLCNPGGGGNQVDQCLANGGFFVVRSISPNTDASGMTNTVIRVIFNNALAPDTVPEQVVIVSRDGQPVAPVQSRITERTVIEMDFGDQTAACAPGAGDEQASCLAEGAYTVEVSDQLKDAQNRPLVIQNRCGDFPRVASFTNNADALDQVNPVFSAPIEINGLIAANQDQNGVLLSKGKRYPITADFSDRQNNQGGISSARMMVERVELPPDAPADVLGPYITGPTVQAGTNDPLQFFYELNLGNAMPAPARYVVTLRATDLDGHFVEEQASFIIVGDLCQNGIQDEGEAGVDIGGECLGVGACNADWQCASRRCENGQCIAAPMITGLDPWDGAAGNFITILGRNFGNDVGQVAFGFDANQNQAIEDDEWIDAPAPADCVADTWTSDWIIVSVPDALPIGSQSAVRVVQAAPAQGEPFSDTTINNHGPKPGPRAGLFLVTDVLRPGLCSFERDGAPVNGGFSGDDIVARGIAFGQIPGNLDFGGFNAQVSGWNDTNIFAQVPQLAPGRVGVRVEVGDQVSNGLPFSIGDPADRGLLPVITSVDPGKTTAGSLVTLIGEQFGEIDGEIFLAQNAETLAQCAAGAAGCIRGSLQLPAACGDTWSNQQIIFQIPVGTPVTEYKIAIRNARGFQTDGSNELAVEAGEPLPGICRLVPNQGPAPLPQEAAPLTLTGLNFLNDPTIYFSRRGFDPGDISTWLSSALHANPWGGDVVANADATLVQTFIPVDGAGVSMNHGAASIKLGTDLLQSNTVTYNVTDCREEANAPQGFHCCIEGEEAGQWKQDGLVCAGEVRDAGYVWRFTTGRIPNIPEVVEQCNEVDWDNPDIANIDIPSPSPWRQNRDGENVCLNASVLAQFSIEMDEASINNNTVRLYTCAEAAGQPDCTGNNKVPVDGQPAPRMEGPQTVIISDGNPQLQENTWYRVELANTIQSQQVVQVLGRPVEENFPLRQTRPCGDGTAYCFEFKTSNGECELAAASVNPNTYTARYLGVIQDPRAYQDGGDIFQELPNVNNPGNPLYYFVWGRGNRVCQALNVDGLGWDWRTGGPQAAAQVFPNNRYADSRAIVEALEHTAPQSVDIIASLDDQDRFGPKDASSDLFVDLGDPRVSSYWPNCGESCTNAMIGMRFNRAMNPFTYRAGITVQKCDDEFCDMLSPDVIALEPFNPTPLEARFVPVLPLEENTWYLVQASDQVVSIGRIVGGQPVNGKPLIPFSWKFRTKSVDGECQIESARITPDPFTARQIGQKTKYSSIPFSASDSCSPFGQELDPWKYGWNWSTGDARVATISQFKRETIPPAYCASSSCLYSGSDVPLGYSRVPSLCGNGILEPGEDCEIAGQAGQGENPGISCSLSCLRPGASDASCGNGRVEPLLGEECDTADEATKVSCANNCTRLGSTRQPPDGALQQSWCGSGSVTVGEDCDLALTIEQVEAQIAAGADPSVLAQASLGCSQSCLHVGTPLSQSWCTLNRALVDQGQIVGIRQACNAAQSVCGDGTLDAGEECEFISDGQGGVLADRLLVVGAVGPVGVTTSTFNCSSQCLLGNLCGLDTIPSKDQGGVYCDGGEGCSRDCHLLGSSVAYSTAQYCGDGRAGIGEIDACEAGRAIEPQQQLGQLPVQVVRAVGGAFDPQAADPNANQQTQIAASAESILGADGQVGQLRAGDVIRGAGDYTLQCGFREFGSLNRLATAFNNCPDNLDNAFGVASNSCCYPRPVRVDQYPLENARNVCLNTAISVSYDGGAALAQNSISGNVVLAEGHVAGFDCAAEGLTDVTPQVTSILAYAGEESDAPGFFRRLWRSIKGFFVRLFGGEVFAQVGDVGVWCTGRVSPNPGLEVASANDHATSTISLTLDNILQSNTVYAVVVLGGENGVKNDLGVSIRSNNLGADARYATNDFVTFTTGADICRVKDVAVVPNRYLFTQPGETHGFTAVIESTNGQRLQPISPVYNWAWSWGPRENPLFDIPAQNGPSASSTITIAARAVEGTLPAVARLTVTEDVTEVDTGKTFSGFTNLIAAFCANPWPARDRYPYQDNAYNFSMSYCADAGRADTTVDDLPYLKGPVITGVAGGARLFGDINGDGRLGVADFLCYSQIAQTGNSACATIPIEQADVDCRPGLTLVESQFIRLLVERGQLPLIIDADQNGIPDCRPENNVLGGVVREDSLLQAFFFNEKNDDIIGIQIFKNPERKNARAWIAAEFPQVNLAAMQDVVVDGYRGVTDGSTFYIDAFNQVLAGQGTRQVYNNIYLFSVNPNSLVDTQQVFRQIIDSLSFNTNITDFGYCLAEGVAARAGENLPRSDIFLSHLAESDTACSTDFDCQTPFGVDLPGTNGVCSNAKTKFLRDWQRLNALRQVQTQLNIYSAGRVSEPYPQLAGGTFIPKYTNSRWPSWREVLANQVSSVLPADPVNTWSSCGLCNQPDSEGKEWSCVSNEDCAGRGAGDTCVAQDPLTCWSADAQTYACPQTMSIFEYEAVGNNNYTIHAQLEYFGAGEDIVTGDGGFVDPNHFTTERWCQFVPGVGGIHSPFGGRCGDGVVNDGEQCDPAGTVVRTNEGKVGVLDVLGNCAADAARQCSANADCPKFGTIKTIASNRMPVTTTKNGYCGIRNNRTGEIITLANKTASSPQALAGIACNQVNDCTKAVTYNGIITLQLYSRITGDIIYANSPAKFFETQYAGGGDYQPGCQPAAPDQCQGFVPGGQARLAQCPGGTLAPRLCTPECRWDVGMCEAGAVCGNGSVEPGELCDDGNLNGKYGQCAGPDSLPDIVVQLGGGLGGGQRNELQVSRACGARHPQYCGNGVLDLTEAGGILEQCENIYNLDFMSETIGADNSLKIRMSALGLSQYLPLADTLTDEEKNSIQENITQTVSDICAGVFGDGGVAERPEDLLLCFSLGYAAQQGIYGEFIEKLGEYTSKHCSGDPGLLCRDNSDCVGAPPDRALNLFNFNPRDNSYVSRNWNNYGNCVPFEPGTFGTPYNISKDFSCGIDCQGPGEYCGDGIVQDQEGEQCDDGNRVDNDGCNNLCQVRDAAPEQIALAGLCGDGVIQNPNGNGVPERCDLGNKNGIACDPAYGESCAYCSFDCRTVLTVDPVGFCGNGKIDRIASTTVGGVQIAEYEACDTRDGAVVDIADFARLIASQVGPAFISEEQVVDVQCSDVGTVSCNNDCTKIETTCVECGLTQGQPGPVPTLQMLNPLTDVAGNNDQNVNREWSQNMRRFLFRQNPWEFYAKVTSINYPNTNFFSSNLIDAGWRIQASPQCSGQYKVAFALEEIFGRQEVPLDLTPRGSTAAEGVAVNALFPRKTGVFDYPVNGEIQAVRDEMIVSPAIPPGYIRVVIRWDGSVDNGATKFVGNVYNPNFAVDPDGSIGQNGLVSYMTLGWGRCEAMSKREGNNRLTNYWWPKFDSDGNGTNDCRTYGGDLYMNNVTHLARTYAQATTIDISVDRRSKSYGFFVQAVSAGVGEPISNFRNHNVTVEVYSGDWDEQIPDLSVYPPVQVYKMNLARPSANPALARYWHVFNLDNIRRDRPDDPPRYERVSVANNQNGIIATDIVDVECNIPVNGICNRGAQ